MNHFSHPINRQSSRRLALAASVILLAPVSVGSAAAANFAPGETELVPASAPATSRHETLRGVAASADQRNDTLTIQIASTGTPSDFKVQDGLLFNAVRYGDPVEITVETIGGAKTITGLKKE